MLALTSITALLASVSVATAAVVAPRADTTTAIAAITATPHFTKPSTAAIQTQSPEPTKVQAALDGPAEFTLTVVNRAGRPVTTHYASHTTVVPLPSPIGPAPVPREMVIGESMHMLIPFNHGGTMFVSAGAMLGQESQIEYTFDNQNGTNKAVINISYVEAYSFSIMCTCSDGVKTGCDVPLFAKHQCVEPDHVNAFGACVNSAPDGGPASGFFADCKGKAYTYAHDNDAVNNGNCRTGDFTCEILPNGK